MYRSGCPIKIAELPAFLNSILLSRSIQRLGALVLDSTDSETIKKLSNQFADLDRDRKTKREPDTVAKWQNTSGTSQPIANRPFIQQVRRNAGSTGRRQAQLPLPERPQPAPLVIHNRGRNRHGRAWNLRGLQGGESSRDAVGPG